MEIPGANQHREVEKVGYLTKLSGRSFPYISQWKRRYCVLSKGRLYYYERENSKTGDKSNGVINLEYFDQVTEAGPKECKKATNVFIITSQDRSFFDPGRHMFSADTLPDMKDWVRKLQVALEQIRNNNRPAATSPATSAKKDVGKKGKEGGENKENKENAQNNTKDRKKKKDSHRHRKSARVGDGSEGPLQGTDLADFSAPQREVEVSAMTSPVGIQLPGMASPRGIKLPGMSSKKEGHPQETKETSDANPQTEDGLPISGPTLPCVTKLRVKGPQGRRVPQNHRRTVAAAALKKRASSLSALEYQDLNDSRSESSQGTRDSGRNSKTTEKDLDVVEEGPSMHEATFDDIDKDIFFSKKNIARDERPQENGVDDDDAGDKKEVKKEVDVRNENELSSNAEVNSGEKQGPNSRNRSRNSSFLGIKMTSFRERVMTIKRRRFETKEVVGHDHPDDIANSRWSCSIL